MPAANHTGQGVVWMWGLATILELRADPVAVACGIAGEPGPEMWIAAAGGGAVLHCPVCAERPDDQHVTAA